MYTLTACKFLHLAATDKYLRTITYAMSRDIHRRVKKAVEEVSKDTTFACVNVETIAKKAEVDTRTVKLHLDLLEEDGLGKFCDPKKKTFSTGGK